MNVNNCAMIFESDEDFGRIVSVDVNPSETNVGQLDDNFESNLDECLTLAYRDQNLPSKVITSDKLSHLTSEQRQELCDLLDSFSQCFSDKPGFCS